MPFSGTEWQTNAKRFVGHPVGEVRWEWSYARVIAHVAPTFMIYTRRVVLSTSAVPFLALASTAAMSNDTSSSLFDVITKVATAG